MGAEERQLCIYTGRAGGSPLLIVRDLQLLFFPSSRFRLYIEKLSVPQEKRITLAEYLQQLSRHRNFLWFVCMNLVQVGAAVTCCDSEDECWLWLFEMVIQQYVSSSGRTEVFPAPTCSWGLLHMLADSAAGSHSPCL